MCCSVLQCVTFEKNVLLRRPTQSAVSQGFLRHIKKPASAVSEGFLRHIKAS